MLGRMVLRVIALAGSVASFLMVACTGTAAAPAASSPPASSAGPAPRPVPPDVPPTTREEPGASPDSRARPVVTLAAPEAPEPCRAADWAPRQLPPLLSPGTTPSAAFQDSVGAKETLFDDPCTDSPSGPHRQPAEPVVRSGVELTLVGVRDAGKSQRGWRGNQCSIDVRLADGGGAVTHLGAEDIPPFNTITAAVRAGSALYLSIGFNGYRREFPGGGNRVVAVDLCEGRVVWRSRDATSNGGLLLLGDYLVSPYGFTSEPRFVYVLEARSGAVVQRLPVVENVCPSESWAPNHRPGDRCDAPGQRVGAATNPRLKGGLFWVDTNTGSATFQLR